MKWFVPFLEQVAEVNILTTYPILFAITIDRYFSLTIIHYSINLLQFMHYIHISNIFLPLSPLTENFH